MKYIDGLLYVCLLLFCVVGKSTAQNADEILDKAAHLYEQSKGIKAEFSIHTVIPGQGVSESFEGLIQMKGDKFKLETPEMITWYDGNTQWVYMERNEEVNISTPSGDELRHTNPAMILRMYKKGFKAAYNGMSTTRQSKAAYDIILSPDKKSDIKQIDLQVEKQSGLPVFFTITDKNGATYNIQIGRWQTGVNQPDTFFVFNEKEFPNAEIVDLR